MDATRKRQLWILLAILLGFVLLDIFLISDLFRHGSTEDLEHASERLSDPLGGPNAP